MKKIYYRGCGGLYYQGKTRKKLKVGDVFKAKYCLASLKIVEMTKNDIIVIYVEK